MREAFWSSYVLLWLLVAALIILVLLLYRQFGLMLMPNKDRLALAGRDLGSRVPDFELIASGGTSLNLTWGEANGSERRPRFLLFAEPTCPLCSSVWNDTAEAVATEWPAVEFIWVDSDGPGVDEENAHRGPAPAGWLVTQSPGQIAHSAMQIPGFPYGYTISADGKVLAKGLVNGRSDVERQLRGIAGTFGAVTSGRS